MCVGPELALRPSVATPSSTTASLRNNTTKSQPVATTKSPLKQISGPSTKSLQPVTFGAPTVDVSPPTPNKIDTPHTTESSLHADQSIVQDELYSQNGVSVTQAPYTPYINEDLSSQMDGITLMSHVEPEREQDMMDTGHSFVMPPPSPPPESYMQVQPKRPRKKRDRYPEVDVSAGANRQTNWTEHDLAPARIQHTTPTTLDMMKEIKHLKMELENAKKQNDVLNKQLLRMAEGAAAFNQLQQYMQHLKLLPEGTQAQTKDLVVGGGTRAPLTATDLKRLEPFGAFRDACVRYPGMPIVLFDLSQPIPVVALANDAFDEMFGTKADHKPWVTFIAPAYLERTKHILFSAYQYHDAVKFVQVYRDVAQNPFLALDFHRFWIVQQPNGHRTIMDLVCISRNPQLNYPEVDDRTFWKATLNENGIVDMSSFPSHSKHAVSSLTASTGITIPQDSHSDPSFHFGPKIDILQSPNVTEVTTPPQDPFPTDEFNSGGKTISSSPLDSPGWFEMTEPPWAPSSDWHSSWPAPHSSSAPTIEELSSPTSPTFQIPTQTQYATSPFRGLFTNSGDIPMPMLTSSDSILPPTFDELDDHQHV